MSSVFDLDAAGAEASRIDVAASGITADEIEPGFFEGGLKGTGLGIARGAAKLGRAAALGVGGGLVLAERFGGYDPGEITDSYFDSVVRLTDDAVDYYTPNPTEVGTAGRVLGGLAEIVAPLALTGGNPAALIASTGLNTAADLSRQGVDTPTATGVGLVDASAVGLGFRLPFLGSTLAKKAATGAAGGVALGAGATAADRAVLEARGYDEIAERYDPLDLEARTVDLLTGAAFGGIAQIQAKVRSTTRSERDAALAGLNARHYQYETAPGRPADDAAVVAHQRAIDEALRQIQEGRPVDVGNSRVTEARFLDAPREALNLNEPQLRAVLDELGIRDTPRDLGLTPREAAPDAPIDTPAALGESVARADLPPGRTVTPAAAEPASSAPATAEPAQPRTESARSDAELQGRAEPETRGEPDDPDVLAAERSLQERDITIETGDVDAEGNSRTVSARESLAAARQEVQNAQREASAFEAAVACALSFGDT